MNLSELIKRLHRAKLVPALISIAFGIALIIARQAAMEVMVKIAAGMLIAAGVGCVLMFFFAPVKDSFQLAVGALLAIIGLLVWFYARSLVGLFPIMTGIGLILNGLSNLSTLGAPGQNAGTFLVVLFSMLVIAAGLFIVFHPAEMEGTIMVYIGVGYVINGILDLVILHRVKEVLMN